MLISTACLLPKDLLRHGSAFVMVVPVWMRLKPSPGLDIMVVCRQQEIVPIARSPLRTKREMPLLPGFGSRGTGEDNEWSVSQTTGSDHLNHCRRIRCSCCLAYLVRNGGS